MVLTVHRQTTKVRPNGMVVYKGEDARPYADNRLIMVADGMGSRGGFEHERFDERLFDPEQIVSVLFDSIYSHQKHPVFSAYVKEAFEELYAVKDGYWDNRNNMKSTAYFGSRIAAALVLALVYSNEEFCNTVFRSLQDNTQEEREAFCEDYGKKIGQMIREKMAAVADRAGLTCDKRLSNIYRFATTLSAAMYKETPDGVDVLYMNVGDSRCYVWNVQDGLMQVQRDRRSEDGSVHSFLSPDVECVVDCEYRHFSSPCVLFNATDGCYDSPYFLSPLSFENLLLTCIVKASSPEQCAELLSEEFRMIGRHDDSSTIALTTIGYEDYAALQQAARERLNTLERLYFSKVPRLLTKDYRKIGSDAKQELDAAQQSLKAMIDTEPTVRPYCEKLVQRGAYAMYNAQMEAFEPQTAQYHQRLEEAREQLADRLADSWGVLVECEDIADAAKEIDPRLLEKSRDCRRGIAQREQDYTALLLEHRQTLDRMTGDLGACLDALIAKGVPDTNDDLDVMNAYDPTLYERGAVDMFKDLEGLHTRKSELLQRLIRSKADYAKFCRKAAVRYPMITQTAAQKLESGEWRLVSLPVGERERQEVAVALEAVFACHHDYYVHTVAAQTDCLKRCATAYWEESFDDILRKMLFDPRHGMSEQTVETVREGLETLRRIETEQKDLAAAQRALFEQYEKGYSQLY